MDKYGYDVAFSFAGEDRDRVEMIAMELKRRSVKVFYDKLEQHNLWGKDLYQYLADVYINQAKYCIIFISKYYIEKDWTRHELLNAQSRAFKQNNEYILPIRIDDTDLPGLPDTIGYLDSRNLSQDNIIDLILKKLGYPSTEHSKQHKTFISKDSPIYWKITSVINSLNPIGLLPSAPADEYGIEVDAIIKEMDKANDEDELAKLIHKVFVEFFDENMAGSYKRYLSSANQIIQLLNNGSIEYVRLPSQNNRGTGR